MCLPWFPALVPAFSACPTVTFVGAINIAPTRSSQLPCGCGRLVPLGDPLILPIYVTKRSGSWAGSSSHPRALRSAQLPTTSRFHLWTAEDASMNG